MDANGRPAWVATSSINLSLSNTYGTLGISQGGTNITSYAGGDMLYASAANTLAKLASSTGGSDLQISSSGYPTWVADPNTMRFPIASTSWPTTGTTSPCFGLGPLLDATTFTKFSCQTDTGTLGLTIASSTAVTDFVFVIASTTAGSIAFPSAHKDFSVGQNPQVCIGGISGAPNQVHCNIDYHRDN